MKKYVFNPDEGITGELHARMGIYRIVIDKETAGAKHFALLVNTTNPGVTGEAHTHTDVEHGFFILEGRGVIEINGKNSEVGPGTSIFVPAKAAHKLTCSGNTPLRYIVLYAPPGPEQELKRDGRNAFKT